MKATAARIALARKVEAILFLENKYVQKDDLCKKLSCTPKQLEQSIEMLNESFQTNKHVFHIRENRGTILLTLQQEKIKDLASMYGEKRQEALSKVLLEVLAIIAYSQPITRAEINSIRGVNSNNAVGTLLEKELIKVLGKKAVPSSPYQFGTSPRFLYLLGMNSIDDLPKLRNKDKPLFEELQADE